MLTSKMRFNLFAIVMAAFMLIPYADASVTVTLENAAVEENNVTLSCSAEATNDTLSVTELYIGIDALELNQSDESCGGKTDCTSTFTASNLHNGTWSWNCKAYNANNESFFSPANGSFMITTPLEIQTPAAESEPAQPAAQPPAAPQGQQQDAARCGDGTCNGQEDCTSCAQDCKCDAGTVCNATGRCEKKSNLLLYLLIGFIVMSIAGFFVVKAKLRNHTGEEESKPAPAVIVQQTVQQPFQQPRPEAQQSPMQESLLVEQQPQQPSQQPIQQEVQMPPEPKQGQREPAMPSGTVQQSGELPELQMPSEAPVQQYIREMRQKGKSDLEISQKLRKGGWKDYEIAMALLTMKKEKPQKQV